MQSNRLLAGSALLFALALAGCLTESSPGKDPGKDPGKTPTEYPPYQETYAYTVEGNLLILTTASDTEFYCEDSALRFLVLDDQHDTAEIEVTVDTLKIFRPMEAMEGGAEVKSVEIHARSGSGSGLEGLWKYSRSEYLVASGTLSDDEKAALDLDLASTSRFLSFTDKSIRFASGKATFSEDTHTAGLAMDDWNNPSLLDEEDLPDSAYWDMTAKAIDRYTVEYQGRKTGETVRVTLAPAGDRIFTSDRADHASHHYVEGSRTCPNEFDPAWYEAFLEANSKYEEPPDNLTKRAKKASKTGILRRFPLSL